MSSIFRASDVQLTPCSQGHLLASTQNITVVLEKQQNKFPDHQYCLALQGSWLALHEEKFHIGAAWRQVSSWGKQCRCRQSETRAMTPHPALWLPRMTSYPAASGTYNTWASLLSGEMKTSVRTSKSKRWLCVCLKLAFPSLAYVRFSLFPFSLVLSIQTLNSDPNLVGKRTTWYHTNSLLRQTEKTWPATLLFLSIKSYYYFIIMFIFDRNLKFYTLAKFRCLTWNNSLRSLLLSNTLNIFFPVVLMQ